MALANGRLRSQAPTSSASCTGMERGEPAGGRDKMGCLTCHTIVSACHKNATSSTNNVPDCRACPLVQPNKASLVTAWECTCKDGKTFPPQLRAPHTLLVSPLASELGKVRRLPLAVGSKRASWRVPQTAHCNPVPSIPIYLFPRAERGCPSRSCVEPCLQLQSSTDLG